MTTRIHRGFHRIGLVLGAPPALIAVAIAVHEARWQASTAVPSFDPRAPIAGFISYDKALAHAADYTAAEWWGSASLVLYVVARAVGWAFAGFVGSGRT